MTLEKVAHCLRFHQDDFPVRVLPPNWGNYIVEAAEALGVPYAMVAAPALAAASAAIGASTMIQCKDGWSEPACLYVAVVAPTGSLKSPSLKSALFPVFEQEEWFKRRWDIELAVAKQEKRARPAPPPRTHVSDATVEALGPLLEGNPYGLLLWRDELSGWVKALNQYRGGRGADRQFYLSAWSGLPITVDRVGRSSVQVRRPHLSVVGTIPPDILPELADDQSREDGFLPRLLFAMPESIPLRWSDKGIAPEAQENYSALFRNLYQLGFEKNEVTGEEGPVYLQLSSEALHLFKKWHDVHCQEMESSHISATYAGFLSKLKGYCLRLALIHAICFDPTVETVRPASIEAAIVMIEYFKRQAAKVCSLLSQPKKTPLERCEREIRRNLSNCRILTKRELQQGGNAKAGVFNTVLKDLIASGQILETQKQGTRKPVKAYKLLIQESL